MNDTPDRPSEPLPARRSQPAPVAPAYDAYFDEHAADPNGPGAKKTSFRVITRALRRHWWQALTLWLIGSAGLMALAYTKIKPTFDAFAQIRVDPGEQGIFGPNTSSNFSNFEQYIQTQVAMVSGPNVLEAALSEHPELQNLPLLRGVPDPQAELRAALRVGQEPKTSLIRVEMASQFPKEAADFVNAVVDAYLKATMQTYNASTEKKIERMKVVKKDQDEQVRTKRAEVQGLQKQVGASDLDLLKNRNGVSIDTYRQLSEELTRVEIARYQLKAQLDQLRESGEGPVRGPDEEQAKDLITTQFYNDPRVVSVQEELERAEKKLKDSERLTRSPSDPARTRWSDMVKELKEKRDDLWRKLEPGLRRKLAEGTGDDTGRRAVKEAEGKLAAVIAHEEALRGKLEKLKVANKEGDAEALKLQFALRDLERAERVFDTIQNNLNQLEYEAKSPIARVEKVSEAKPSNRPNANKRTAVMAASPLVMGMLVVGLLMLLEMRGARVNDPEELTSRLHVQVIGVVPPLPQIRAGSAAAHGLNGNGNGHGDGGALSLTGSDLRARRQLDEFVQSLDHLRVALCARRDPWGRDRHCVLITSACGSEGKTTLAAQLAERCVNAGLMTLLIDADLRNPTLSRMLDAAESPGLINVLRGEMLAEDVITVVGDAGGFHLLPAGTPRVDPSRLLQGERLGKLVAQARESFDMIIVDAPPVLPVPDALTIGKWTDGAVLAVRYDTSRFPLVERANRRLAHVGVTVIGAVVNGVRSMESAYGGYYTYGGYGDVPAPASAAPGTTVMGG
jgi:succinoglycan biosynthesis transport protein ExoP